MSNVRKPQSGIANLIGNVDCGSRTSDDAGCGDTDIRYAH